MPRTLPRKNFVFVYGSLRKGLHNHGLLDTCGSEFVDQAKTIDSTFTMTAYSSSFPAVYDGGTERIFGELYEVSDECVMHLDGLEGHPNWYKREERKFDTKENGIMTAWIYVMQGNPEPNHCKVIDIEGEHERRTASWNRHIDAGHFDT